MAENNVKAEPKKNIVWSTKRVDAWMKDYADGLTHKENPWLDGRIGVKRADLVFEYTEEEIQEITRCARDVIYFANKYCYCMQGSRGYQPLTLRDYQEDMLRAYQDNRFNITLSCRQIGKCFFNADINIVDPDGNVTEIPIEMFYAYKKYKKSFLFRLKLFLYRLYHKL